MKKAPITAPAPRDLWVFAVGGKRDTKHVFSFSNEEEARRVYECIRKSASWSTAKWWGRYSATPPGRKR